MRATEFEEPIRMEMFKAFLRHHGAVVCPSRGKWEVLRFKSQEGAVTYSYIYRNKENGLSFTHQAAPAFFAWKDGKVWKNEIF